MLTECFLTFVFLVQTKSCTFDFLTVNQEIVTRCVEVERWAGFDLLAVSM